ncbi:glycosyltransferase [Filomicrobium sp.]|uniref:glycosyltransferase n=1 Tax=Filomicrobium sp. TaxID=2024831 RepID=UPI002582ECC9|nr:glycosyltransferase [Filomicrobium sp.]MCV0369437.1 glycosyltransferase [Filomicrobium sp.]
MKILFVGPGNNHKYGGGFYYAFHRRLINGFIRSGHFVYAYSDRDTADYALGVRQIGSWLANKRLLDIAKELRPEMMVLLLSYLITPQTVRRIRELVPGIKIAAICIDDIDHERPAAQFRYLLEAADAGFATTGGETLQDFAGSKPVAFIPNPIDLSIDTGQAFAETKHRFELFFACHQPPVDARWQFIAALQKELPSSIRVGLYGNKTGDALRGADYVDTLSHTKIGLNLNRRDGDLYASDRMGQFLGNGLLLATPRASGYDAVFSEDEMLFFDGLADLSRRLVTALGPGEPWRKMARAGREKAIATMNETCVARFICDFTMGGTWAQNWTFSEHAFAAGSNVRQRDLVATTH